MEMFLNGFLIDFWITLNSKEKIYITLHAGKDKMNLFKILQL